MEEEYPLTLSEVYMAMMLGIIISIIVLMIII